MEYQWEINGEGLINMKKILFAVTLLLSMSAIADINEIKAKNTRLHNCTAEKGVTWRGKAETKLNTAEIEQLLSGNTLLSVDSWGTFAIYYPTNKKTVGWMPKLNGKDWSKGTVTFENDKYCRQWKEWNSGKKIKCWEIHRGEQRIDMPSFYFVCGNGVPIDTQHIVFPGNYLNIEYSGNGMKSGKLTQDNAKSKETWQKYFADFEK